MGDMSAMYRKFDHLTYFAEVEPWNVEKFVHVTAARTDHVQETMEMDALARRTGNPAAIVGAIVAGTSRADTEAMLDEQMRSPRFRGVRAVRGAGKSRTQVGHFPTRDALAALAERGLILDLMAHPDQLEGAADLLEGLDDLTVVVEHTGWPRNDSDDEFALWLVGMERLASLRSNVYCKLSGLAMPLRTASVDVYRRWIQSAVELFGVGRCMFASNFPVDGVGGSFDELYSTYDTLTAHLDDEERNQLFATNAERVYRC